MSSWRLTQTGGVHMGHQRCTAQSLHHIRESSARGRKRGSRSGMDATLTVRRLVSGVLEGFLGGYLH